MIKLYTTSQVVRRLERHPDWVFEAPDTSEMSACRASVEHGKILFQFENCDGHWETDDSPYVRSDWRLVSPKREKRKRVGVKVGSLVAVIGVPGSDGWTGPHLEVSGLDSSKSYDLYAVKRRGK